MKKDSILKHFSIIGLGTLLNMFIGLLTTPIITRIVSPNEYGQFSIFTMYSNIIVMVFCLGLDQALVRYYYEDKSIEYKNKLLKTCLFLPIIISLAFLSIICILSYFKIIKFEFNFTIILLLCVYSFIQIIYRFSQLIIRLEYNSKLFSSLNVLLKVIYLLITIFLIYIFNNNYLLILVISTILSAFICLLISIISKQKIWFFSKNNDIKINTRELLYYSLPFIITMSVTTLFQAIDKISLNYFCSYSEVGVYSSAMSLVHIFAIVQTTFNTLWSPMAIEQYTKDNNDKTFYQKGNELITIIMFFIGINLIFFKDIFAYLLGEKYRIASYVLPFLIFNPIMYTISETTVNGLVFKKKSNVQVLVALGACLTNIIGNFIMVPIIGSKGAAISTGLSYIVFFSLRTYFSNKYFYIDFKLKKFYFITLIVSIYALYATFYRFDVILIVLYFICLLILFLLYYNGFKFIFDYVKKLLLTMKGRFK